MYGPRFSNHPAFIPTQCLEEIFTKLTGKQQLKARYVCKKWNKLLCECRRLLQKTIGVSLDFSESEARSRALQIASILQTSSALKVHKVSVSGGMFQQLNLFQMEIMEPEQYFEPFSFESVDELTFYCIRENKNFNILNVLLRKMSQLKTVSLKLHVMINLEKALQGNGELDHVSYASVERIVIDHTYEHPIRMWSTTIFKNIGYLCERLPNLKSIVGVPGFNKEFYIKFSHLLECPVLEITDENLNILQKSGLQVKKVHLYQDLCQEYDSTGFWQYLNQNPTNLVDIHLDYNDGGIDYDSGDQVTIPHHDYSKVKHLNLHYGVTEAMPHESLQLVFKQFANLVTLELRCFIHGDHFFGHEPFQLTHLQKSTIYLHNCIWNCDDCLNSLMKSLTNVKSLRMSAFDPNIVQSIGKNISQIRELYFEWPMQELEEDFYMAWPSTTKLEKLVMPGQKETKLESITHFCDMCPDMKRLELYLNEPFPEDVLDILLEKLKFLELVRFKHQNYVVTVENGNNCFKVVPQSRPQW